MKKLFLILVMVLLASPVWAVGPLMVDAHRVVCDRNVEADMSGYYVYWRSVVTPPVVWDNTKRSPLIPQVPIGQLGCQYDLLLFNLPNGNYEVTATAIDISGNESGVSNIVPFLVDLPASPGNLRKQ